MEYELYHYGVKGMKWGVRRADLYLAKRTYRNRKNKAFREYERSINNIERSYKRGQNLSDADMAREAAAEKKYSSALAKAKSDYNNRKLNVNSEHDKFVYGKRGADRIAKRVSKGQSYNIAKGKELAGQVVTGVLAGLVVSDLLYNKGKGIKATGKAVAKGTTRVAEYAVRSGREIAERFMERNRAMSFIPETVQGMPTFGITPNFGVTPN